MSAALQALIAGAVLDVIGLAIGEAPRERGSFEFADEAVSFRDIMAMFEP